MSDDQKKSVLVVEDQVEISEKMISTLTRKGYHVLHAVDAESAIKLVEQDHLSMILTDLELPTLNSLMDQVGPHGTFRKMLVVVIDNNHPQDPHPHLKILNSFEELDELISKSGS